MHGIDWSLTQTDNVNSELWIPPSDASKGEEQISPVHVPDTQFSRADSIAFADQYRIITYGILSSVETPLSTTQIHKIISATNQNLVLQLEQRKSTSCMAKMLSGDSSKRFVKYINPKMKNSTFFGISGKVYSQDWIIKTENEKPLDKSHKNDVEQTEHLREYVKSILIQDGNKPMTSSQIIEVIKKENFELAQNLASKNKNYLVKTIRRDPKKRFNIKKGPSGVLSFSLNL